ncbi:MAG TPA: serine protease [Polyangia bacterium]|nr:serine protease [Polyangia bacterium]
MRAVAATLALAAAVAACRGADGGVGGVGAQGAALIYGDDDRSEVFAAPPGDPLARAAASSLVALGLASELAPGGGGDAIAGAMRVTSPSAAQRFGLCAGERFAEQPSFAICSGVAVAPHLVLTAAHCLQAAPLSALVALSGFRYAGAGALAPLAASQVHAVDAVLVQNVWRDYALLRVTGDALVPAAGGAPQPHAGDAVFSVGHGMGVPAKIDRGGAAYDVDDDPRSFLADLDAFGGASGAPVFAADGALLGVLTSGSRDYTPTADGCNTIARGPAGPGAANEQVLRVRPTIDEICARQPDPSLCAGAGTPADGCALSGGAARANGSWMGLVALAALLGATLRRSPAKDRSAFPPARARGHAFRPGADAGRHAISMR